MDNSEIQPFNQMTDDSLLQTVEAQTPYFLKYSNKVLVNAINMRMLEQRTGYKLEQKHGQRLFSIPNWEGPPPPRGSEVYLKVDRTCFEYDLEPILSEFGQIYELRLMMDFSGSNRGFAYVKYISPSIARRAVQELNNNHKLRKNVIKFASLSDDNCRLFVRGIPEHLSKLEIFEFFSIMTENLEDVILSKPVIDSIAVKNRGMCFLVYSNHSNAARARRELLENLTVPQWNTTLNVDWSIPDQLVNTANYQPGRNIYVKHLPENITFAKLVQELQGQMDTSFITCAKINRNNAFISFVNREEADFGLHVLEGMMFNGQTLQATWARPIQKSRERDDILNKYESRRQKPSLEYCPDSPSTSSPESQPQAQSYQNNHWESTNSQMFAPVNNVSVPGSGGHVAISNFNVNYNLLPETTTSSRRPNYSMPPLNTAARFLAVPNVNISNTCRTPLPPLSPLVPPMAFGQFNYNQWSTQPMSPVITSPPSPTFVFPQMPQMSHPQMPQISPSYLLPRGIISTPSTPLFQQPGQSSPNQQYFQF